MRTVIITGANRGIGLELARLYKQRGDRVSAAVRASSPELDELGIEIHEGVDVTSDDAVRTFTQNFKDQKVDILFNNAGILTTEDMLDMDYDRIRQQFEVNTLGVLRVTAALAPVMTAGSKVAILTSRVGSMTDNQGGGYYGYRISKTAVNMVGKNLSIDLAPRGIGVYLFHPGHVSTAMINFKGTIEPDVAATGMINTLDKLTLEQTGTFWHAEGYELPW